MDVLIVQPPLKLSRHFIDYPWLDLLAATQAAAILRDSGYKTSILNGLSGPGAKFTAHLDAAWLGRERDEFLTELERIEQEVIILHAGPWFAYMPSRQWLIEIIDHLKTLTNSVLIVAELHQEGMHYVESDPADLFSAGADIVQRYSGERFCANLKDRLDEYTKDGTVLYEEHETFDLSSLPPPAWDLVDTREYFSLCDDVLSAKWRPGPYPAGFNTLPIITSRGCPYHCSFCSHGPGLSSKDKHSISHIALDRIEAWLRSWISEFDLQRVVILDDVANLDGTRFTHLLDMLRDLDLGVELPNGLRADLLTNQHVDKLCPLTSRLKVSLESPVERVQKTLIRKNLDANSIHRVAKMCLEHSLPLEVHGLIGIPGESKSEIMDTLSFFAFLSSEYGVTPRIQFATPLLGTRLHRICKEENLIPDEGAYDISSAFTLDPIISTKEFDESFLRTAKRSFEKKLMTSSHRKVIVNLTYRCNNSCVFCAVGDRDSKDADLDFVMKRISKYREQGFSLLDIDGGEPTLHPGLIDLLERAKKMGFERLAIITNARRASYPEFAKALVDTGLDEVLVSLHSSNPKIQESLTRVPGSFEQTVKGIQNLMEAFGGHDSLAVNTTMVKGNIHSLYSMGKFLLSLGVQKWNLQLVTPFGRAGLEHLPSKTEVLDVISSIVQEHKQELSISVVNIPPCDLHGYEHLAVADFEKMNRDMVFVGEQGENLQSYLASRRRQVEKCSSCAWRLICPGEYFF